MQKKRWLSDRSNLYTYNIMLGSACNWNCPYCIQQDRSIKQADPFLFYDSLIEHLCTTKRLDKIYTFQLWGGEPLLYWNILKVLIERLSILPIHSPIRITSNGSLLDKDKVRFLNKYSDTVHFEISYHEGKLSKTYWNMAMRIHSLTISSLFTHKVTDFRHYKREWEKLGKTFGRFIPWCIFPIIYSGKTSKEYALTKEDIENIFDNILSGLKEDPHDAFLNFVTSVLIYGMSSKGLYIHGNKCHNPYVVSLDMVGNQYICHHDYDLNGQIGNIFKKTKSIPILSVLKENNICLECNAYKLCTGGCFRNKDHSLECFFYKKLYAFIQTLNAEFPNILSPDILKFV